MTSGDFKALVAFVEITVTKKNALGGSKLKFVVVIWAQIWIASTTKNL